MEGWCAQRWVSNPVDPLIADHSVPQFSGTSCGLFVLGPIRSSGLGRDIGVPSISVRSSASNAWQQLRRAEDGGGSAGSSSTVPR